VADSGEAGLALCRARRYDALIVEVGMAEMDGFATTRRFRQLERESGQKPSRVIGVTSAHRDSLITDAKKAGMDGVLLKPVSAARLSRLLWAD